MVGDEKVISIALSYLFSNKKRLFFTVLAITIAVFSVQSLVSISEGMRNEIKSQLEDFGPRTMVIIPVSRRDFSFAPSYLRTTSSVLTEKDYYALKNLPFVHTIAKSLQSFVAVSYKGKSAQINVFAVEPNAFLDTASVDVSQGRFLVERDRKGAVVGADISDLFDEEIRVGSRISIGGEVFRVVGVLEKKGNAFFPVDRIIIIPYEEGKTLFNRSTIDAIRITVEEGRDVEEAERIIKETLRLKRGVKEGEEDFSVISPRFVQRRFLSVLDLLSFIFLSAAFVSFVVGAVGITNSVLMNVLERRREIAVLRAVGAKKRFILALFLIESFLLGVLGALFATVFSFLISLFWPLFLFKVEFVIASFLLAGGVGVAAGYLPSKKAAELEIAEALRYE